jgi:hypothetical protein
MCYKPTTGRQLPSQNRIELNAWQLSLSRWLQNFLFCAERSRFYRLHKARTLHLFHLTLHSQAMSVSPFREHSSDFAMHWTGEQRFCCQEEQLLSTTFSVTLKPAFYSAGYCTKILLTVVKPPRRDKFYPPPSTEATNAWTIISNTPSSRRGAQLFKPSGNFAFIYVLTFNKILNAILNPRSAQLIFIHLFTTWDFILDQHEQSNNRGPQHLICFHVLSSSLRTKQLQLCPT